MYMLLIYQLPQLPHEFLHAARTGRGSRINCIDVYLAFPHRISVTISKTTMVSTTFIMKLHGLPTDSLTSAVTSPSQVAVYIHHGGAFSTRERF